MPRAAFEEVPDKVFKKLMKDSGTRKILANLLISACYNYNFDGVVLEFWFQLAGRFKDTELLVFVEELGK